MPEIPTNPPEASQSVSDAASSGDRRATLIAMRDRLALDIDSNSTTPRDRATLTKQMQEVLKDLESLKAPDPKPTTAFAKIQRRKEARAT